MIYCRNYKTRIGIIKIMEEDGFIIKISSNAAKEETEETPLLKEACRQINEYINGKREKFTLPLKYSGTAFRIKVWDALREIEYGKTVSYGDIAERIGNPKASRAVGQAIHNNPIMIVIPCHRVIGKDGSLTGFGGGLDLKEKLLKIEEK